MMPGELEKEPCIRGVLARLRDALGPDAFVVVDHWQADGCAVGVARPSEMGRLAYLAADPGTPGRYYVELEFPTEPGSTLPYRPGPAESGLSEAELVDVVAEHLMVRRR